MAHQAEENSLLEAEVEGLQNALAQLRSNRDPAFQKITTALALADKSCQEQRLQVESLRDELSQQARKYMILFNLCTVKPYLLLCIKLHNHAAGIK